MVNHQTPSTQPTTTKKTQIQFHVSRIYFPSNSLKGDLTGLKIKANAALFAVSTQTTTKKIYKKL